MSRKITKSIDIVRVHSRFYNCLRKELHTIARVQHGNINQFEYPNPISMWPLYIFKKYCQVSRHMIQPIATLHPSIRYRTVTEADPDLRQRHSLSNPLANQNHVFYQIIDYSYYSISFYT